MSLGSNACFAAEHIERHRGDASPVLAEQVVYCLELVAQLEAAGLPFMFKGGNSLLLLLDEPRRFSIDIDIATDADREDVAAVVEKITNEAGVFNRFTRREHKTKPWLPMISFHLYYPSHFVDDPEEAFIMLDVQLRLSGYPKTRKAICCGELYRSELEATVPTVASLIGDKLLTLGPATLGIPLGKKKEAQRIKHVCDVATLSRLSPRRPEILAALEYCLKQENDLQRSTHTLPATLADTLLYLASPAVWPQPPSPRNIPDRLDELVRGREPFAEHLIARHYPWERMQEDLARVSCMFLSVFQDQVGEETVNGWLALDTEEAAAKLDRTECDARLAPLSAVAPAATWFWLRAEELAGRKVVAS